MNVIVALVTQHILAPLVDLATVSAATVKLEALCRPVCPTSNFDGGALWFLPVLLVLPVVLVEICLVLPVVLVEICLVLAVVLVEICLVLAVVLVKIVLVVILTIGATTVINFC